MENNIHGEWAREVYNELQKVHKGIADTKTELLKEISVNREEFVIFKTKVNTRTAMISTIIGTIVLITSLLLNIGAIRDRQDAKKAPVNTEITP